MELRHQLLQLKELEQQQTQLQHRLLELQPLQPILLLNPQVSPLLKEMQQLEYPQEQ